MLTSDLAFAWRSLRRRPLFLLSAVLTLALAVGGNLAIGSLVYTRFVADLPYPGGDRLAVLGTSLERMGIEDGGVPASDFQRWRQVPAIDSAYRLLRVDPTLVDASGARRVRAALVEPGLLELLGAAPRMGSTLSIEDASGVVLSHAVWQREYGADPTILGRELRLEGEPRIVRGVMAPEFDLLQRRVDYLLPLRVSADEAGSRQWRGYVPVLRLAPGHDIEDLRRQIETVEQAHRAATPEDEAFFAMSGYAPHVLPLREWLHGDLRPALRLLQGAVLAILGLACANVGQLLLLRAGERRAELGLRQALGARRRQIATLVSMEAALLAGLGTVAGLGIALLTDAAIAALGWVPPAAAPSPGVFMLAALALAVVCTALSALPAMFGLWRDAGAAMRPGARTTGSAAPRLRQGLVVAQTALTVVLLIGAGLLLRSFAGIIAVDPGFARAGVLTATIDLPAHRYPGPVEQHALWDRVLKEVRALPGVSHASLGDSPPFGNSYSLSSYRLPGVDAPAGGVQPVAVRHVVDRDYFTTLGIALRSGRALQDGDAGADGVVVDERFVARHFPDGRALGLQLLTGEPERGARPETIVGVVARVHQLSLEQPESESHPAIYRLRGSNPLGGAQLLLRSDLPLAGLIAPLREALQRIDPELPLDAIEPLQARIDASLDDRRAPLTLLGVFAAVALTLAVVGQYGLVAWGVAQRETELGLRMAIGARRRDVLWLVLLGGLRLTVLGLGLGLLVAALSGRLLQAQLYGVQALDPLTYAAVAALLAAIALAASLRPALRASRIPPAAALRGE